MNRRSFIQSMLVGVIAPAFLPGANRIWKRSPTERLWRANLSFNTCGSITRTEIVTLSPTELGTLFAQSGADLDDWFQTGIEMKTMSVPSDSLYDWLMTDPLVESTVTKCSTRSN